MKNTRQDEIHYCRNLKREGMQIKQHIIKEPELIAENSRYSGVSKSSIFGWNFFFGSFYKRENKNIKKVLDEKKMLW